LKRSIESASLTSRIPTTVVVHLKLVAAYRITKHLHCSSEKLYS